MSIDFSGAPHAWEKEKSNFVALLDLKLESVEHGKAVMRMPYRSEITNGTGAVHGGARVGLGEDQPDRLPGLGAHLRREGGEGLRTGPVVAQDAEPSAGDGAQKRVATTTSRPAIRHA